MKKATKPLSLLLAAFMLLTMFPLSVFSAETLDSGECGANAAWTPDGDGTPKAVILRKLETDESDAPSVITPGNEITISYDANSGTGAPKAQTKPTGASMALSDEIPKKSFTLSYNANGGSVSPASKTVDCPFAEWNTEADGSGDAYAPEALFTGSKDITLYAQWIAPKAGDLPTPSRDGYTFTGWFTSPSGKTQITSNSLIGSNLTLFAHWEQKPVSNRKPGDVNNDGKVTAADARLALRKAVGLESYAEGSPEFLACDVDGNGKVTAADARKILRAAVGLEELDK